jgi:hypothetical protein
MTRIAIRFLISLIVLAALGVLIADLAQEYISALPTAGSTEAQVALVTTRH